MYSTFAIIGYGSAALHLIHAAVKLKESITLIPRNSKSYGILRERYNVRYNQDLPELVTVLSQNESFLKYRVGLVATPPMIHSASLQIFLRLSKSHQTPTIFVEKPMHINLESLPKNVVSDSHLNFSPQWNNFLNKIERKTKSSSIARIESNFVEDLTAAAQSHAWRKNFTKGWLTNEGKGGGVLGEYSHALHWLGKILQKIGEPLPLLEEIKLQNGDLNKDNRRMKIVLQGYSSAIECIVRQEMSFRKRPSSKFVRVTFENGSNKYFDFAEVDQLDTRILSRTNLLSWLLSTNYEKSEFSLMREKASWINSIIHAHNVNTDSIIH